ncbi:uncharacterized protein STEHIDRAFT_162606 [Stereum hirsutum FP-91666 SS1]|uniref:uncharacterized protein n=1 Tax=Stereum hirsutum (strain FP-91666) TaxID=721885 RepID=UPI000444995F|nr:uncharacterized protein STEHIDRAFT_162606 [Stereum hirsutum FP-91666 SS1]EIM80843.1 hypothetical protein STEHIDRAFT_162606 [Stereum hirsutum FP-91666 SS1]
MPSSFTLHPLSSSANLEKDSHRSPNPPAPSTPRRPHLDGISPRMAPTTTDAASSSSIRTPSALSPMIAYDELSSDLSFEAGPDEDDLSVSDVTEYNSDPPTLQGHASPGIVPDEETVISVQEPSMHTIEHEADQKGKRKATDNDTLLKERDLPAIPDQNGSLGSAATQSLHASGSLRRKPGSRSLNEYRFSHLFRDDDQHAGPSKHSEEKIERRPTLEETAKIEKAFRKIVMQISDLTEDERRQLVEVEFVTNEWFKIVLADGKDLWLKIDAIIAEIVRTVQEARAEKKSEFTSAARANEAEVLRNKEIRQARRSSVHPFLHSIRPSTIHTLSTIPSQSELSDITEIPPSLNRDSQDHLEYIKKAQLQRHTLTDLEAVKLPNLIQIVKAMGDQLGHRAADLTIPRDLAVTACDELAEVLRDISPFITSLVNIPVSQDAGLPPSSTSEVVPPRLSANQSERIKGHEVAWREKQRQLRSSFDKHLKLVLALADVVIDAKRDDLLMGDIQRICDRTQAFTTKISSLVLRLKLSQHVLRELSLRSIFYREHSRLRSERDTTVRNGWPWEMSKSERKKLAQYKADIQRERREIHNAQEKAVRNDLEGLYGQQDGTGKDEP